MEDSALPSQDNSCCRCAFHTPTASLYLQWFTKGFGLGRQIQRENDHQRLHRYRDRLRTHEMKFEEEFLLREHYRREAEILRSEILGIKDQLLAAEIAYEQLALSVASSDSQSPHWRFTESRRQSSVFSSGIPDDRSRLEGDGGGLGAPISPRACSSMSWNSEDDFDAIQQIHLMDESGEDVGLGSRDSDDPSSATSISPTERIASDDGKLLDSHFHDIQAIPTCRNEDLDTPQVNSLMSAAHNGDASALRTIRALIQLAQQTPKRKRSAAQVVLLSWRRPSPTTSPASLPIVFVDASSYGIGFVFGDKWLAWRFKPNHPLLPLGPDGKLIMSWAELIAVELAVRALLAAHHTNVSLTLCSDNDGVVKAVKTGKWTPKFDLHKIVRRIFSLCEEGGLRLEPIWVSTKANPADKPSRGVYPPEELAFRYRPSIPSYLSEFIQDV